MGPAEKRPQGPLKAAPNPLTLSPPQSMPSERRLVKRLIIDTNAAQPSDFEAMVPALPPLSGGHKSPPNVPWVGHKQLDNLKAARERSLGRGKRSSFDGKSEAAGEGKAGAEEQLGALSTQGNSYSHENEVGAPSAQEAVPKGRKSPYARLLREGVEAERLQPVVTRARAKTPSKLRPAGHEERLVVGGESSGAHEENGENRTRPQVPPSRHSISALDNHLPCQDSLDPAEEALHPSPSRSLLSFARHGPSVLAAPNLTEPTPDSPLASTKYDLEVPAARGGEGPHSCPPRRSKRRGAELSENAAGLLIGAADRVRTAMLEQLHELASPRSRHALQRALQPLPNGNHRSKTVQYTHSKHAGPSYESDLDAEVAWVQGTESSGKVAQERSWSVPPTRAESSALWQRSLYPMLSAASRSEMAEFKGLLVESLKKAGQSERDAEEKADLMFGACFHEIHRRMPALQKALANSKKVARVLHEENSGLRRALTALERKQDQAAMDTWLQQHGDRLAQVLVVAPEQARPRQGAPAASSNPFLRLPTVKLGSLGGPAAPPANGMWPSMKAGAAKLSEDENDDATVPEIAESSQSESALAIAQSEQFLAGLKLGMAARRTVAGEKAPGGQRVKGPARVDEGVQTEGVPGDGGPGDSGTAVGEGRQGTSEKGAKQSSFFREGGQRAFDPDVALRREAGGGADENGERDGVTDERGPGKRVWNPFRRAGGLAPGGGQGPEGGKEREHETEGGDPEADSERKQGNAEPPAVCAANETSEGDFDLQPSIPESPGEAGTESANDGEPSRHEVAALNSYQNGVPEANRDDRTSEDVSAQMLPQADANGTEEEDDGDQSQGGNLNSVHSEEATNCGNNEAEHSSLVGDPPGEVSSPDVPPAVENEGYGATEKHESGAVSPNQSRRGTRRGGEQPAADTESLPKVFERLTSNRFKSSVPATLDLTAPSVVLVLDTERGDLSPVSPGPRSPDLRIGGSPLPRLKRSESLSETVQRRREKAERRKTHGEFLRLSAAIYEVPPPKDRHGQSGGIAEEVPSTVPESPLPGGASPELPATPQEESNPSPSDQRRNSEKRWADEWDLANAKWQADVQRLQEENARARAQVDERERARQGALEEVAALRAELERMRAEALAVKESAQIPQDDDARIASVVQLHGGIRFLATQCAALLGDEQVELRVERTGGARGEVGVHYLTLDGSAHAGLDFASTEGLLTWPEGAAGPQSIWVQLLEDEFGEGEQEFSVVLRLEGQTEAVLLSDQTARVTVSGPGSARWERAGRKRWQKPAQERRPSSREVGTSVEEDGVIEDMGLEAESDEEKESGENGLLPATRALHSGSKWKHKVNETREAKGLAPLEFSKRMHIPEAWERFIEEGPPGATAGEEEKGEESPTNGGAPGAAHRASSQHGRRSESPNGKRAEMLDAQELEQRAAEAGKAAAVSGRAELVLKGAHRGKDLSTFLVNNARVMPAKKLRALIGSIYRAKQAANAVDDKAGRGRAPLSDLVVGHLKHMFGLRSLAQAKLQEMLASLRAFYRRRTDHLAGLFTRLTGLYDDLPGHAVNSVMQILEVCAWSLNGQAAFWSQLERGDSVLLTHAQVEAVVARVLETRPREQIEAVLAEMREQNRAGTLGDDAAFAGRRSEAATSPSAAKKDSSLNAAATRAASPMSVHSRAGSRQGGRPPNRPPEPARASAGSLGGTQQRGAARNPSPLNGEQGTGDVSGDVAAPVALDRLLCFLVTKSSQLQEKDEELVHTVLDRFMEGDAPGITREGFHQAVKQLDLPAWLNEATVDQMFELAAEMDGDQRPSEAALSIGSCVAAFRATCPGLHAVKEARSMMDDFA